MADPNIRFMHPNFKSIYEGSFPNYELPLISTYTHRISRTYVTRGCPPFEQHEWEDGELDSFEIYTEDIDRIYASDYDERLQRSVFALAFRVEYKHRPLYINFLALNFQLTLNFQVDNGGHKGEMYLTYDANVFINVLLQRMEDRLLAHESLLEEGIWTDHPSRFALKFSVSMTCNVPTLKFLCCMSICKHRSLLSHYAEKLPNILVDMINWTYKVTMTNQHYREKHCLRRYVINDILENTTNDLLDDADMIQILMDSAQGDPVSMKQKLLEYTVIQYYENQIIRMHCDTVLEAMEDVKNFISL